MPLTCCIPQSCPAILCNNLRKGIFQRKLGEERFPTSGEAPLSTKSFTTSRNPALAAQWRAVHPSLSGVVRSAPWPIRTYEKIYERADILLASSQYLNHVIVPWCCSHVQTGPASIVSNLEQLCGPGEQQPHHPHMASDAGQVQGYVATGLWGSVNLTQIWCQ